VKNQYLLKKIAQEQELKENDSIYNLFGRINTNGYLDFKICSLNLAGAKNNTPLLNEQIDLCDVVAYQEGWNKNLSIIKSCFGKKNVQIFQRPATRISDKGRYSGGIGFIVNQEIKCEHEFINDNIAILLINKLMILNVYLPYYDGKNTLNYANYEISIKIISSLLEKYDKLGFEIILVGDFNTDFSKNIEYSKLLLQMCKSQKMRSADIDNEQTVQYTYYKKFKNVTIKTWIDHMFVMTKHSQNIKYMKILDRSEINNGDHNPLIMTYKLKLSPDCKTIINEMKTQLLQYHKFKCAKFILYRDSNWQENLRKPYLIAKNEFKCYKKYAEKEKANKKFRKLNEFFKSDINGFWREVKKMRMVKQLINVPIDEIKKQYKNLFNNSNFPDSKRDEDEKRELEKLIEEYKTNSGNEDMIEIKEEILETLVNNLKNGKSTGFSGVSNEMMKNGWCKTISNVLKELFEWMINTGTIPHLFNISILKPLIKDESKGNNNLNNLRPLSISDIYTNLFEKIILLEVQKDHEDHPKQFGFKKNSSCNHANFILSEIIKLNKQRKHTTYVISIDASKAFDRVGRYKLWITLVEMKIRVKLIIALKNYYENFYIIVNNEKDFAAPFSTTYGVKQGGCISPELYKLYCEILAILISLLKLGVKLKKMRIDILMYADDIILIATSIKDAQTMLDTVTEFSKTHQVKFNPEKTNLVIYKSPNDNETNTILLLCGEPIVIAESIKYLGVMVNNSFNNQEHIDKRTKLAYSNLSNLYTTGVLNKMMCVSTKISLLKIYIKPLLYYGLEALDLNKSEINDIKKCESSIVKQLMGISKYCHTEELFSALSIETTEESIYKHKLRFLQRLENNSYTNQFITELRMLNNTTGSLTRISKYMKLNNNSCMKTILDNIQITLLKMERNLLDRHLYNPKVNEIKEILSISNTRYRTYKLYKRLANNNYDPILNSMRNVSAMRNLNKNSNY